MAKIKGGNHVGLDLYYKLMGNNLFYSFFPLL